MTLGSPAVSTGIGAEGIAATDGKDILIADSPEEFAEAIDRLFRNAETFEALRQAGRSLVEERYDWGVLGRQINRIVDELARNGSKPQLAF